MDKQCSRCKRVLEVSCFQKNRTETDGLQRHCKDCRKEHSVKTAEQRREKGKLFRAKHRERIRQRKQEEYLRDAARIKARSTARFHGEQHEAILEKNRQYHQEHREENNERKRQWKQANPEKVKASSQRDLQKNRTKRLASGKRWREANRDKHRELNKQWREANRDKIRNNERKRSHTDPMYALNKRVSTLMRLSLRQGKNGVHWEKLVGYTLPQLKKHLEKQFTAGMNWDMFMQGAIEIDHIIPRSAFYFDTPEDYQFKQCWTLNNLRPMWQEDNRSKRDKLLEPFQQFLL